MHQINKITEIQKYSMNKSSCIIQELETAINAALDVPGN